jgi:hypothetical protein
MARYIGVCEHCGELVEPKDAVYAADLRKLRDRLNGMVDGYTELDSDLVFCIKEIDKLLEGRDE